MFKAIFCPGFYLGMSEEAEPRSIPSVSYLLFVPSMLSWSCSCQIARTSWTWPRRMSGHTRRSSNRWVFMTLLSFFFFGLQRQTCTNPNTWATALRWEAWGISGNPSFMLTTCSVRCQWRQGIHPQRLHNEWLATASCFRSEHSWARSRSGLRESRTARLRPNPVRSGCEDHRAPSTSCQKVPDSDWNSNPELVP